MYIPSLLFGGKSDCVAVTGTTASGSFQSGSEIWDYYKFANVGSASFQVLAGSTVNAKIFMVAGGGGGGVSFDNSIGGLSAGGGGAGGVVYTTARLGAGTYPLYVGDGGTGSQVGQESWIDIDPILIPSTYLSYFTSGSRLTAEGGGSGAWFTSLANGFNPAQSGKVDAVSGGSGGGGIAALRWSDPPNGPNGYVIGTQGSSRNPQGFNGGTPDGFNCVATSETTATGGGGVKSGSANTDCTSAAGYQTPGGEGDFYNVDGTPTQYAYGGASMRTGVWEAAPYDSGSASTRAAGAGGWGTSDLYPVTTDKELGRKGEIVLLVPVCDIEKIECTTYSIGGGAGGGNVTYIPCGESELTSSIVIAGDTLSICSFPITSGTTYPSGSGTVTVSAGINCTFPPPTGSTSWSLQFDDVNVCSATRESEFYTSQFTSLTVGNTLYTNDTLSAVTSSQFQTSGSTFFFTTDINGDIITSGSECIPCENYQFGTNSDTGIVTWTPCGTSTPTSSSLAPFSIIQHCLVSGSSKSITGNGATITYIGTC